MTRLAQKRTRLYRKLLARFVYNNNLICPFKGEVEWCPGEIRVKDVGRTSEIDRLRRRDPNLVWHHIDDDKDKAGSWNKIPEIEDPGDCILAHRTCHDRVKPERAREITEDFIEEELDDTKQQVSKKSKQNREKIKPVENKDDNLNQKQPDLEEGSQFKVIGDVDIAGLDPDSVYKILGISEDQHGLLYKLEKHGEEDLPTFKVLAEDIHYYVDNPAYIEIKSI